MRAKLMAAGLVAALWGGVALADEYQTKTTTTQTTETTSPTPPADTPNANLVPDQTTPAMPDQYEGSHVALTDDRDLYKKDDDNTGHVRGVTVMVGGGVEGYTGGLASQVRAGPEWGATVALKPTKVVGLELGYSGAANELNAPGGLSYSGGLARGADIVRNGGRALVSLGLTAAPVQPYIAGGVGFDHYSVHATDTGFHSDNAGSVPLAAGLRAHIHGFTADARVQYGVLFDNSFAGANAESRNIVGVNSINAGQYEGTLSIGTSF